MAVWIIYIKVNRGCSKQNLGEKFYHSKPRRSNTPLDVAARGACALAIGTRRVDKREGGDIFVVEGSGCGGLSQKKVIHHLRKMFSRRGGKKL